VTNLVSVLSFIGLFAALFFFGTGTTLGIALALLWIMLVWALYSSDRRERVKYRVMAETARRLGFSGSEDFIAGVRDGHRVEIRVADLPENEMAGPEIVVGDPRGKGFLPSYLPLPFEPDPNDARVLAALDAPTRNALPQTHGRKESCRIVQGRLILSLPPGKLTAARLLEGVDEALLLASRLSGSSADIRARLARTAREDPSLDVRLSNLEALAAGSPSLPLTCETLRALRDDPAPEMRLLAASLSGEKGFDVLAAALRSSTFGPDLEARALAHVVADFPVERIRQLVDELLVQGPDERRAALLRAIGEAADATWEDLALTWLAAEAPEVRHAAIRALGSVGSKTSIGALREIERYEPLELLQSAATEAVAKIQARLGGAAAGQVSLMDDGSPAGRVVLAQPEEAAGRVALAPRAQREPES